jgi:hypothetical protein
MKRDSLLQRALLAFGIALLVYVAFYTAIERRRASKGPWQVTFTNDFASTPAIIVNQPALGITNVQISFVGESNSPTIGALPLQFGDARVVPFDVPFGKCVFLDTTFLPGTVALKLFGHEIQLLPRVLTIDHAENLWISNEKFVLTTATNEANLPK